MHTSKITGAALMLLAVGILSGCGESQAESTPEITTTTTAVTTTTVTETTTTTETTTLTEETTTTSTDATLPPISEDDTSALVQKGYRTGYDQGYADGLADGEKRSIAGTNAQTVTVWVSGDFTATVHAVMSDFVSDEQNRTAVVTLFQDMPFVLRLSPELCAQLQVGESYTFIVESQEADIYAGQFIDESTVSPEALLLNSFRVSEVRAPEEDEYGLDCWRVHYTT